MSNHVQHWLHPINSKSGFVLIDEDTGAEAVVNFTNVMVRRC